nr:hypothetical protein Ade03nite_10200 [Actinoplanes derwentensis]
MAAWWGGWAGGKRLMPLTADRARSGVVGPEGRIRPGGRGGTGRDAPPREDEAGRGGAVVRLSGVPEKG